MSTSRYFLSLVLASHSILIGLAAKLFYDAYRTGKPVKIAGSWYSWDPLTFWVLIVASLSGFVTIFFISGAFRLIWPKPRLPWETINQNALNLVKAKNSHFSNEEAQREVIRLHLEKFKELTGKTDISDILLGEYYPTTNRIPSALDDVKWFLSEARKKFPLDYFSKFSL